MKIETTKMSSKGQIVIPRNARDEIKADEGTIFSVMANKDTIILKKMEMPSRESLIRQLEEMAKEGRMHLEKLGIKESDIPDIVHRSRNKKG